MLWQRKCDQSFGTECRGNMRPVYLFYWAGKVTLTSEHPKYLLHTHFRQEGTSEKCQGFRTLSIYPLGPSFPFGDHKGQNPHNYLNIRREYLTKFNIHLWFLKKTTLTNVGIEGTHLSIIKDIYDKPTADIILNTESFLLKSGTSKDAHSHHFSSTHYYKSYL